MPLHFKTELLHSVALSKRIGTDVYLKLENCQPSGSFKIRGIGRLCEKAIEQGSRHFVSSSGGNAGVAAAYAARKLGVKCTVVTPTITPQYLKDRIKLEGAEVLVHGSVWNEADEKARELLKEPGTFYISPFNHPDIWEGHSTLVEELHQQLGEKPRCVVVSVGGAGLFCGVIQGLQACGWGDVPVLAVETSGAASFRATLDAGEVVTIPAITSIAICLGSKRVCDRALELSKIHTVISEVVEDSQTIHACLRFADHHQFLVEPACGAALSVAYDNLIQKHVEAGKIPNTGPIVVIVCGGKGVTLKQLGDWKAMFGLNGL